MRVDLGHSLHQLLHNGERLHQIQLAGPPRNAPVFGVRHYKERWLRVEVRSFDPHDSTKPLKHRQQPHLAPEVLSRVWVVRAHQHLRGMVGARLPVTNEEDATASALAQLANYFVPIPETHRNPPRSQARRRAPANTRPGSPPTSASNSSGDTPRSSADLAAR